MKHVNPTVVVTVLLASLVARAQDAGSPPAGWFYAGPPTSVVESGEVSCGGKGAALRSTAPDGGEPHRAATLMQLFRAERFRGQRLRFSGVTATRDVAGTGALWLRVDAANRRTVAFDNMQHRALHGTTKCERHALVVDVPAEAEFIALGMVLDGAGVIELSNVEVEAVDRTVPTTDLLPGITRGEPVLSLDGGEPPFEVAAVDHVQTWFDETPRAITARTAEFARPPSVPSPLTDHLRPWIGRLKTAVKDGKVVASQEVPPYSGSFTLRREGAVTIIEGNWGTVIKSYPVTIRYDRKRVDMSWGFYERHLTHTAAPQVAEGCLYYEQLGGTMASDQLTLCGDVLSDHPGLESTVVGFLMAGFYRTTPARSAVPREGPPDPLPYRPPEP